MRLRDTMMREWHEYFEVSWRRWVDRLWMAALTWTVFFSGSRLLLYTYPNHDKFGL